MRSAQDFSDRVALNPEKFGRKAKIVQIDIDKSEISKNVAVDKNCVGDVKEFLQKSAIHRRKEASGMA